MVTTRRVKTLLLLSLLALLLRPLMSAGAKFTEADEAEDEAASFTILRRFSFNACESSSSTAVAGLSSVETVSVTGGGKVDGFV